MIKYGIYYDTLVAIGYKSNEPNILNLNIDNWLAIRTLPDKQAVIALEIARIFTGKFITT